MRHPHGNAEAKLHHSYLALKLLRLWMCGLWTCGLRWCPHVPVFLRTAHLPIDCTEYDGEGEGGGRQYIVWPFYAYLTRPSDRRCTV